MSKFLPHLVLIAIAFVVGAFVATKFPGKIPFLSSVAGS